MAGLDPWTWLMSGSCQAVSTTRTQVSLRHPHPAAGRLVSTVLLSPPASSFSSKTCFPVPSHAEIWRLSRRRPPAGPSNLADPDDGSSASGSGPGQRFTSTVKGGAAGVNGAGVGAEREVRRAPRLRGRSANRRTSLVSVSRATRRVEGGFGGRWRPPPGTPVCRS